MNPNDEQTPVRSLPQAGSSEAAVLGSMMVNARCVGTMIEILNEQDLAYSEHRAIWRAILADFNSEIGERLDGLTVRQRLDATGELAEIGGAGYLTKVIESVPGAANAVFYAKRVLAVSRQRQLIQICTSLMDQAYGHLEDVSPLLEEAEQRIFRMVNKSHVAEAEPVGNLVAQAFEEIERRMQGGPHGVSTGFYELDGMLGSMEAGQMIVVAGRPSMGKTALALNIAEHAAIIQHTPALVMSMEMGKTQVMQRLLCSRARVDAQKVRHGDIQGSDYNAIVAAANEYADVPLWIDETAALTPMHLRSKCRRWRHLHKIGLVVVDYMQLMHVAGRTESRQQEITQISRELKCLARELDIPIMVLSQLNRATENRPDHKPRISDLRESGSIEQDADVIMLLHREDYYHRDDPAWEPTHTARLIVAKQRNGPTGVVDLTFQEHLTRFDNLARAEMFNDL